jgi:hypothetical protein
MGFFGTHASSSSPIAVDLDPQGYWGQTACVLAQGLTKPMVEELRNAIDHAVRENRTRRKAPNTRIAEVSDTFAKSFQTKVTQDDGAVYSALGAGTWRNGPGAILRALDSAGSESKIDRLETTPFPNKAVNARRPIRTSYSDFQTLKSVYDRDGLTIVYAVSTFYYGAPHYEPNVLVYGTREAAEQAMRELIAGSSQSDIIEGPLGQFLPPLKLGTGKGEVILDPFHQGTKAR